MQNLEFVENLSDLLIFDDSYVTELVNYDVKVSPLFGEKLKI